MARDEGTAEDWAGRCPECGCDGTDESGGECTCPPYTSEEMALAGELWKAANDEGTIQAYQMLRIAPHSRPELHTTTTMGAAFRALTGKEWDAEYMSDALA